MSSSSNWRKNIEDSLKDGVIITTGATRIFFELKVLNVVKTTKDIQTGCYGYDETCRLNLWRGIYEKLCSLQQMDQRVNTTKNFITLTGS